MKKSDLKERPFHRADIKIYYLVDGKPRLTSTLSIFKETNLETLLKQLQRDRSK